ncbi:MAG: DUF4837 family protein [candidate division WOR-3 bacterium]|nr:DUF4837 family protein [candidate division WOR-3 bacterium]MCX7757859.1 DUF4837 family protein [candidate division WOR-3 bacterium]MDW7987891.1 DUF4837 family protein [candidate division WOR-3 bacterium]
MKGIIFVLFALLLFSCTAELPTSIGKSRQIIVLCNHLDIVKKILSYTLERPIYTVQPEPEFTVQYHPLALIDKYFRYHTLFIIGLIDEEPISSILARYREKIMSDTFGLFAFSNLWARGQNIYIFAARDLKYLSRGLTKYESRILKTFQKRSLEYMSKLTYARGYNRNLEKTLSQKYKFSLKLPFSFKLNSKYQNKNFLYFVAHNPERSIFVHFSNLKIPLEPENLINIRDSLTNLFYEGDYVYQQFTYAETVDFNNNMALKLIGVWQNNKYLAGGPFLSYAFYVDTILYIIDGMVFNPGQKKLDYLLQIDAILHTFRPFPEKSTNY